MSRVLGAADGGVDGLSSTKISGTALEQGRQYRRLWEDAQLEDHLPIPELSASFCLAFSSLHARNFRRW